jgi:serine/threonine-protein kinase
MTPERWETIKDVFEAALELEGEPRTAFLHHRCVGDPSLRAEVVDLIASHEHAGGFMGAPAFAPAMTRVCDDRSGSVAGSRIGPYQIIREI